MQRVFSSFPEGPPGAGLPRVRLGVGLTVIVKAMMLVAPPGAVAAVALLETCSGLLLIIGLLTPYAGTLLGLMALITLMTPAPPERLDWDAALLVGVTSITLALAGPGAYSIDARLFGRREIIVPPTPPGRTE